MIFILLRILVFEFSLDLTFLLLDSPDLPSSEIEKSLIHFSRGQNQSSVKQPFLSHYISASLAIVVADGASRVDRRRQTRFKKD